MGKHKKSVSDEFKQKHPKNRATKTELVFDEDKRHEFLTGFRKRKQERKRIGAEQKAAQEKEEKRRVRQKRREEYHAMMSNDQCAIPEVAHLVDPVTYELPQHTVTVTDVSNIDFVGGTNYMLGANQASVTVDSNESDSSDNDNDMLSNTTTTNGEGVEGGDRSKTDSKDNKGKKKKWSQNQHKNYSHTMSKKFKAKKRKQLKSMPKTERRKAHKSRGKRK